MGFGENRRTRGATVFIREDVLGDALPDVGQYGTQDIGGITEGIYKDDAGNGGKVTVLTKDGAINPAVIDHGGLGGLGDDDHPLSALVLGRAGEDQTVRGDLRIGASKDILALGQMDIRAQTAPASTPGFGVNLSAGKGGGPAFGGGILQIDGGAGGDGTVSLTAGNGGTTILSAGNAGADNGGPGGLGGGLGLKGGAATGSKGGGSIDIAGGNGSPSGDVTIGISGNGKVVLGSSLVDVTLRSTRLRADQATPIGIQVTNAALTIGSLGSMVAPVKTDAGAPVDVDGGNLNGALVWNTNEKKLYARSGVDTYDDVAAGAGGVSAENGPFTLYADQLENPNNINWAISALAPAEADDDNNGLTVRAFDDGPFPANEEGVGFSFFIPSGVTNIILRFIGRARTAPGDARTVGLKLYSRGLPDTLDVQGWSIGLALTDIDIPITDFFQEDSQTIALAAVGLDASPGEETQFELTRVAPGGTDLTGDWLLRRIQVEFS